LISADIVVGLFVLQQQDGFDICQMDDAISLAAMKVSCGLFSSQRRRAPLSDKLTIKLDLEFTQF